jgi:formylglycine-generating enzyme required for sulfatase activity
LTLPKGTLLGDSYRVERVIGSGGFGITYEAEDINLGSRFALKEYYPFDFGDRDSTMSVRPKSERHRKTFDWGRVSFLQEARMLARFRHPSIVRVSRVFEAFSTAYMVMEFEQGQNFETWLAGLGRPPTQEELDRVVMPLLDALELMHAENFLHRDIAPDNIVIRPDGSPVLLDFGAARRAVGEMSRSLTGIVKAGYSPQEQYATDGRLQGPWTDLYALGATLYRAVTGHAPEEATLRMADDRLRPTIEDAKGVYRENFLSAIDACLRPKHADRPQSVAELRRLLFGHVPAAKRRARVAATTRRIPDRRPLNVRRWLAIAAAVALVAGAYGGFEYARRSGLDRAANGEDSQIADVARKKTEEEAVLKARAQDAKRAAEQRASQEAEAKRVAKVVAPAPRKTAEPVVVAPPPTPQSRCDGIEVAVGESGRRCLRTGEAFKDCEACPEMVVIPAGSFVMGSRDGPQDERPAHPVHFGAPFAVARYEATFAEWEACVGEKQCASVSDEGWGKGRRPVINVRWRAAKDYAEWLSERTKRKYRLLSEAEWEYAARAGTTTAYAFGDAISERQAHYSKSNLDRQHRTVEVGSFQPNGFGLYDMHGNVSEWVADSLHPSYVDAPRDGSMWAGGSPAVSVIRGGSWNDDAETLRSAFRGRFRTDAGSPFVGFRVGRTLD